MTGLSAELDMMERITEAMKEQLNTLYWIYDEVLEAALWELDTLKNANPLDTEAATPVGEVLEDWTYDLINDLESELNDPVSAREDVVDTLVSRMSHQETFDYYMENQSEADDALWDFGGMSEFGSPLEAMEAAVHALIHENVGNQFHDLAEEVRSWSSEDFI